MQVGVQSLSWAKWHKAKEAIDAGMLGQVVSCHGTYSRNDPEGDWNWPIDADAGPDAAGEARIEWNQWLGPATKRKFSADRFFRFRKYWDYSGGIATDLHYHTVAPFHLAVHNEHPTRVAGMGGLWIYNDGREVPDTFLNAADYPSRFSVLVQSSQVNAFGPAAMIRGQHATMLIGDDWEGRELDTIRIVAEKPFAEAFRKKWGKDEVIIAGAGNEGDEKHLDNFFECVRSRRQPACNADLGYKVMTHIGLAVRSYREGKVFYFDPRTEKVLASAPA
jgi:predicted dehydrogenase